MEIPVEKLKLSKILKKLQIYLIVNFITKLPLVAGKDVILVVYDKLFKITYFVVTTEGILTEELVWLFRDNVWKIHGLLESVVSDRRSQFIEEIMKELNRMLEIEIKLLISFHLQTDSQTGRMDQELEQYLQFFVNYKQKDWPEQLALVEFTVNKAYSATKVSLFIANYDRELQMRVNIRRKEKVKKAMEFVEKMKKV